MTSELSTALDDAWELSRPDRGLAIVSTARDDGTIQSSLVNTAVIAHPGGGERVLAFVTYGKVKIANLRARPQVTTAFRSGWNWSAVEGRAELAGPGDPQPWLTADRLPGLLREIFQAAGGTHDDWDEYDRVMAEQGRTAVLIAPARVYGNPQ
jgi:PPOX class probable F420-dependent enzyme